MGQRTQVKKVLADVESKLADLDAKLDANELEKDEVQVIYIIFAIFFSKKSWKSLIIVADQDFDYASAFFCPVVFHSNVRFRLRGPTFGRKVESRH